MSGFRKFVLRGNMVDLAVAVVVGTAFAALIKSFVSSFITPLLGLVGGSPDFSRFKFKIRSSVFTYGAFLTDVLSFVISAAVVYFVVVLPVARLLHHFEREQKAVEKDCPECTLRIPIGARRCPECTAEIPDDRGLAQAASG